MDLNKLSRTLSNNRSRAFPAQTVKPLFMPFSFQGFGVVAILAMVAILAAAEGLSYLKERFHHK